MWATESDWGTSCWQDSRPPRDLCGQLHDADAPVGADNLERAAVGADVELDVGSRRLQHVGSDLGAVFLDDLARLKDGLAGHHQRLGAAGAAAGNQLIRVILQQVDLVERNAEP